MTNTSAYECQECGVELDNTLIGYCEDCQDATWRNAARNVARKLARKPQDFDCSPLPLFGDSHKQKELF